MINVFYRPEQSVLTTSYSPSASKPKFVINEWFKKFPDKIKIKSFEPVTEAQLCEAHSSNYIFEVLRGHISNGFGNKDISVARSLPYTSGSLLAAAKHALEHSIAVSPTSGFHHSEYFSGAQGFCTINGLMVTAIDLLNTGKATKVGICDCDFHYGNGTDAIIKELNLKDKVFHFTAGKNYHSPSQAFNFLKKLPSIVKAMSDCDIIIYQAGADPHINDPLGGFLTTGQMRERDRIVFETCKAMGVPVVWNLAGGYQLPFSEVLKLHVNTMEECLKVYETNYLKVQNEKN